MDKMQLPSNRMTGRAIVEVGMSVVMGDHPKLVEAIQAWIRDTWMPLNKKWETKLKPETSPLFYSDSFYSEPKMSIYNDAFVLTLDVNLSSMDWRDWLVFKLIQDMEEHFHIIMKALYFKYHRIDPA